MACYTAYLASGQNLICKTIKAGTISRYLNAAAELSVSENMINPCLDTSGKQSKHIRNIITEVRRWEIIPNRREPITKEIISYITNKGKTLNRVNPNNIYSALSDWLILGLQSGFRRKEWAQDHKYLKRFNDIQRNVDGSSAAFILEDFEFRSNNNKRINQNSNNQINKATTVNIKWRYQKNNDNGQVITYVQDNTEKEFCYVRACKRIYHRAKQLKQKKEQPIAIFTDKKTKNKIHYIDDIHISSLLQEAASKVYNINKKGDLNRFTSHSIRVGACVLLHSQNISTEDIKFRLRWRSDSFRMYLRNITQLAERHREAIAKA